MITKLVPMVHLPPFLEKHPVVRRAQASWTRDHDVPLEVRVRKAAEFARGIALAKVYLHAADELGEGVRTHGRPRIVNHGTLRIGAGTVVRSVPVPAELVTGPHGLLRLGTRNIVNVGVSIAAHASITIGDRALIGPYVMINDTAFHDLHERHVMAPPEEIVIEDDVWLGAKSSVLPGVHIGRGSVVAAHALVNRDVPEFVIVSGVPAVIVAKLNPKKFRVDDDESSASADGVPDSMSRHG